MSNANECDITTPSHNENKVSCIGQFGRKIMQALTKYKSNINIMQTKKRTNIFLINAIKDMHRGSRDEHDKSYVEIKRRQQIGYYNSFSQFREISNVECGRIKRVSFGNGAGLKKVLLSKTA